MRIPLPESEVFLCHCGNLVAKTCEAASQKTPALALKRRNCGLEAGFALTAAEVVGVEGNSPTHDSLTCSQLDLRTVSFRSSCLRVPAFQELATAAAPRRADLHTRHRHGATQEETEGNGGDWPQKGQGEKSKEPGATPA